MIWVYIASLIFGGAFTVPMILGGLDFDADVGEVDVGDVEFGEMDFDTGTDLEFGDTGADTGGGLTDAVGDFVASLINFRSIVLGAAFFGLSGVVLTTFGTNVVLTLVTAILLGLVAAVTNSAVTTYVLGNQQSSHVTMRDVSGTQAEVMLPISADRSGRVRAQIAGQTEYFTAVPYKPETSFERGESVVVVQVENGLAKVASLKELGL